MSAIESLDLSDKKLSGSIPWQLTQLSSLEVFSVAYNNLSGAESYVGNVNLHNVSQGDRCSSMPGPVEKEAVEEASDDPVLYIISGSSFVLAFWGTVMFMFFHSVGQHVVLQL
ncbi:hypothetical protein SETIT_3G373700v2 [Setaria italica]|uniref:Uncharacterized protein n=1 Tax=Setaria italica TaxID=4555 RepID=A0A368QMY3_SETIT|nr:hypothetical protein SETIT_3G373700v2 [Setaria italica]